MRLQKIGIGLAAVAALGAGVVGGTALAAGGNSAGQNGGPGGFGHGPGGYGGPGGFGGPRGSGGPGSAGGQHTQVTGDELAKVKAAVAEKDSAVTVKQVWQDSDGSYDVIGTKSGQPVMLEVTKDLATVTERTGGPGRMGHGGPPGTAVTGDELAKVKAAVADKDSAVTVKSVRQLQDGSYVVLGTTSSKLVMLHVSKDLATVTEETGRPGGLGGPGGDGGPGRGGPGGAGGYGGPPPAGKAPANAPTT